MMKNLLYEIRPGACEDIGNIPVRTAKYCQRTRTAPAKILCGRLTGWLCVFLTVVLSFAASAAGRNTVRVGYYENEVFQEGSREDAMKSGYAYEYYR